MKWNDVLEYKSVRYAFHIELSNNCNSQCPFCPRFLRGTPVVVPSLINGEITIDNFKKWITPEILSKTYIFNFCGTQGDPITARHLPEIAEYIAETNPKTKFQIRTNGGVRNKEFWQRLGKVVNKNKEIVFSVDGLSDTNHLYRRNVKWDKLITNMQTFIDAGGKAVWECLIFKHNEHQMDEIKELAIKMGFADVLFKSPIGFENIQLKKSIPMPVYDKNKQLDYVLEPSLNYLNSQFEYDPSYQHNQTQIESDKSCEIWPWEIPYDEWKDLEKYEINCKSHIPGINLREVYINPHGNVYPCCFIAGGMDARHSSPDVEQVRQILGKTENYNLELSSLDDILRFFDTAIGSKWESTHEDGRCAYCSKTCGAPSPTDTDRLYVDGKKDKMIGKKKKQTLIPIIINEKIRNKILKHQKTLI